MRVAREGRRLLLGFLPSRRLHWSCQCKPCPAPVSNDVRSAGPQPDNYTYMRAASSAGPVCIAGGEGGATCHHPGNNVSVTRCIRDQHSGAGSVARRKTCGTCLMRRGCLAYKNATYKPTRVAKALGVATCGCTRLVPPSVSQPGGAGTSSTALIQAKRACSGAAQASRICHAHHSIPQAGFRRQDGI